MSRDILTTISELSFDGSVCLYPCCKQTMNNWVRAINEKLTDDKYDWRVVGSYDGLNKRGVISAIPKGRYDAVKYVM